MPINDADLVIEVAQARGLGYPDGHRGRVHPLKGATGVAVATINAN
jgi:hypothetical protein